jgi:hypothetical protein
MAWRGPTKGEIAVVFTVVRFLAGEGCSDETLTKVGGRLNAISKGAFRRLDHIGRRFSVDVSSKENWSDHISDLLDFLSRGAEVIAEAQELGISVQTDMAIEPEDLSGLRWLTLEVSPLVGKTLSSMRVTLCVSIYRITSDS